MIVQPTFVLLLYVIVRCADIAITSGMTRQIVRAIVYGIVAILALVAIIILILGVKV